MARPTRIKIANDNVPLAQSARYGHARVQGQIRVTEQDARPSPTPTTHIPYMMESQTTLLKPSRSQSLNITLTVWLGSVLLALGSFFFEVSTAIKALASLAVLWGGLWCSYVSADHGHWRLSELAVVTALGGLLGAVTTAANVFGLGLSFMDGLILMSILPLFIGSLMKSRICVLASILSALAWAMFTFSDATSLTGAAMLLPFIFAGQLYVASRIKSGLAIATAIATGYYVLLSLGHSLWSAGNLPLTFAAAALFIIGVAHHRSGKAAEDHHITGSALHIHLGWLAAMSGALVFQSLWLSPELLSKSTSSLSVGGLTTWKVLTLAALTIIFCSGVMRYKQSQITFFGIFLLTLASAILPMMLWFPAWPQSLATALPGIDVMQSVGVMIGASILAMGIGMILNGARRHSTLMIGMGLCAIVAQAYLLPRPSSASSASKAWIDVSRLA